MLFASYLWCPQHQGSESAHGVLLKQNFLQVYHTAFIMESDPDDLPSQEQCWKSKGHDSWVSERLRVPSDVGWYEAALRTAYESTEHALHFYLATEWRDMTQGMLAERTVNNK